MTELRRQFPAARLRLAPCLVDPGAPDDRRMGRILADQVHTRTLTAGWRRPKVILVDHGSPTRAVAAVRDHLGGQLRTELGDEEMCIRDRGYQIDVAIARTKVIINRQTETRCV